MKFPTVETNDLNGKSYALPQDFEGKYILVLIAYLQWQQQQVDSWVPFLDELEQNVTGFRYYELPLVGEMGWFGRKQLDFFMRTGIPDKETRSRTLTLYIERAPFREKLGIETEAEIALLLLDPEYEVVWRGMGAYDAETAVSLRQALL